MSLIQSLSRIVLAGSLLVSLGCKSSPSDAGPKLSVQSGGETRQWTVPEIQALSARDVTMDGHAYRGVSLRKLLGDGELAPDQTVVARGADGYTQTLAATAASRDECIVAHQKDGKALGADEGPVRIVLAGSPGLSVRNLVELRVEKR